MTTPATQIEGQARSLRVPLGVAALVIAANLLIVIGPVIPWVSPMVGFALIVGAPAFLLYTKLDWATADHGERLGYSVVTTILLLMLLGLGINTALPHLGVPRPLDRIPILITVDALILALWLWRFGRTPATGVHRSPLPAGRDKTVIALSVLAVIAAVAGAIRLNNGASGVVTLSMLLAAGVILILLLVWRDSLRPGTITTAIYCVSLALLLMTSMRGWYTTGHDIQREYNVFELTLTHGNWRMSRLQDAYNACLSITILPTMLRQITRLADPYVYKILFQVLFAFCPVLVYRLARRYTSTGLALLATIYFIAFPTFFGDMPFLNRQEIAFLFVAAAILIMSNRDAPLAMRRVFFAFFSVGVVLSHYSTTYVFVGTLIAAWLAQKAAPLFLPTLSAIRRRFRRAPLLGLSLHAKPVVGILNIFILVCAAFLWTGTATHTSSGLGDTLRSAAQSLRGSANPGAQSSDVSYGLFSLHQPTKAQRLGAYATTTLEDTQSGRNAGIYYPKQLLAKYSAPVVPTADMPLTVVGRALRRVGLNVSLFNTLIRQVVAKLLQFFIVLGLATVVLSKRKRLKTGAEYYFIALGAFFIVMLQALLPIISVDYGILRAFLQALMILCPFMALGTVTLFGRLGERRSFIISSALCVFFFLSLTGALPQLLGGYQAQLHLNNSGQYYSIYYTRPEEVTAITWLQAHAPVRAGQTQPVIAADEYTFARLQNSTSFKGALDIYPTLLRKDEFVFLGTQTVQGDLSTIGYEGDMISYRYPIPLLDNVKNLIYSNTDVRIYR